MRNSISSGPLIVKLSAGALASVWPHDCTPKDSEETYGLLNSAGDPRVNSVSRKDYFSSKATKLWS